jgi:hypothetical protein
MPILDLKQRFDITPKTSLPIPGDGRVSFALQGSIDVPNPLVAQQIYDAVGKIAGKAKTVLQTRFDEGADKGWDEARCTKVAASVLDNFYEKATKAIDKVIDSYVKMNSDCKVLKVQDYAKVASTATSVVLKITRLVISGGTDIMAWASLAKTIYDSAIYLQKAISDIPTMDKKTRASVEKACKYYKDKYLKNRESTWDRFKKFFSDPLTNAKGDMDTLSKRLIRAEKPCHEMSRAIEAALRLQDSGEVSDAQAKKLHKLLVAVSNTMGKVTPAKNNIEKMVETMGLLEADIQKFKSKNKPKKGTPFQHVKKNMDKKVKELKKWTGDRAVGDWASAASNVANIAREFA